MTKRAKRQRNGTMLDRLKQRLAPLTDGGIALAFSGGVDSSLLLAVLAEMAAEKPFKFVALTMQTVLQSPAEAEQAAAFAKKFGAEHHIFTFNPFAVEAVRFNRTDRCYHCKKAVFAQFADYAAAQGLQHIIDGTNGDDAHVYRPGRKALKEMGVLSPLSEFSKSEIRALSAQLGLSTASKPAAPCLATRFPYDTELTDEKIARAAQSEAALKALFPDFGNIRLRVHGNLARVEVPQSALPAAVEQAAKIANTLKIIGFDYVTLDLEGFRSGSFDIGLKG